MSKFLTWFQNLNDKLLHFVGGFLVALVVGALSKSIYMAVAAAFGIGIAKEGLDWVVNKRLESQGRAAAHDVDVLDIAATLGGGAAAALLLSMADWA